MPPDPLTPIREHLAAGRPRAALDLAESLLTGRLAGSVDLLHLISQAALADRQPKKAVDACRRLASLEPAEPRHLNHLAFALLRSGDLPAAERACRDALRLRPDYPEAWYNLGLAAHRQDDSALACLAWREATRLRPDYHKAWTRLAAAQIALGHFASACEAARSSVDRDPDQHRSWLLLAEALAGLKAFPDALDAVDRSLALADELPALYLRAGLLRELGRLPEAIHAGHALVDREPESGDYWNELGRSYDAANRLTEAQTAYERAFALFDRDREAAGDRWHGTRFNRAINLLKQGRFEEGWPEFQHRWEGRPLNLRRSFTMPLWDGGSLEGRHLIVATEQGIGDSIQCFRYLSRIRSECRPARLTLAVTRPQAPLLGIQPGIDALVIEGEAIPAADAYCLMMDLPRIFQTRLDTIPADVPYLTIPSDARAKWASRLATATTGKSLRIGLAWQGDPKLAHDHHRSFPLAALAPVFAARPDAAWIALQIGDALDDIARGGWPVTRLELPGENRDLLDTAALMTQLDLVIAPDTMLAHLAGALGIPVWVPLSVRGEWRWLTERPDSPWYPTLRLFRQSQPGDWPGVMSHLTAEIQGRLTAEIRNPKL
ncbi:MAG: glycosyltransferase family protein [Verrucomicrobiales bacterium]|nr:glycosyltransferase family protein [Verrucomicrobiales bacterium]